MQKRRNSEKKIENEIFKLKIGTTSRENPQVVYVEGGTFITPLKEQDGYSKEINHIRKIFKDSITKNLRNSNLFENNFILDMQISERGITPNKKSFLSFQFLMRQNKDNVLKLKDIREKSDGTINNIISSLQGAISDGDFIMSKKKR